MAKDNWKNLATQYLRDGRGLKAASAHYRGSDRRSQRNPGGMSWGKIAVYAVVGYVAYKALVRPAAAPPAGG